MFYSEVCLSPAASWVNPAWDMCSLLYRRLCPGPEKLAEGEAQALGREEPGGNPSMQRNGGHGWQTKDIKGHLRLPCSGIARVGQSINVCSLLTGSPDCVWWHLGDFLGTVGTLCTQTFSALFIYGKQRTTELAK